MAWDTEATRRSLLDAGARAFADRGFAGASLDAIATTAGVNKERVYAYFGNKRQFFEHVLCARIEGLLAGVDLDGTGPEALGELAGVLFDRLADAPDVARLMAWESLELDEPVAPDVRGLECAAQAAAVRSALPVLDDDGARHLLLSVVTLVTGWWSLRRTAAVVLGDVDDAARRAALVAQATSLAGSVSASSR